MLVDARNTLAETLDPFPYDRFFDEIVGQKPLALVGGERPDRAAMIGDDPAATVLKSYSSLAPTLTCHAHAPTDGPPQVCDVASPEEFRSLIREYHLRGYTVRIPDVTALSQKLQQFTRALETLIGNPVEAAIFWSDVGAEAPVHYDDCDIIVIQLSGTKKWFISNEQPSLPNTWKLPGEGPPPLDRPDTIDVVPGDFLYVPGGIAHTVHSTTESIHLSIGFTPITVREAIIAALDQLSDLERPLRAGATNRADDLACGRGLETLAEQVRAGLASLQSSCNSDEFIEEAMDRRRARKIRDLPKLKSEWEAPQIAPDSVIRRAPLAATHLAITAENVDLSYPGDNLLVHRGAEESLRFVTTTPQFRISEIPGEISDDVRVALVGKLLSCGVLELADTG